MEKLYGFFALLSVSAMVFGIFGFLYYCIFAFTFSDIGIPLWFRLTFGLFGFGVANLGLLGVATEVYDTFRNQF